MTFKDRDFPEISPAGQLLTQMFMETNGFGGRIDPELARQKANAIASLLNGQNPENNDAAKMLAASLRKTIAGRNP